MRVAVVGAGGVGGYFGGRLAVAGEEVTFIARGEHLQALREDGLRVWKASKETSRCTRLPPPTDLSRWVRSRPCWSRSNRGSSRKRRLRRSHW
ncbi:MAG: 2-dehydropantoate 2-reductase N-terminal domain-containing protein [Thermoanaerobaculia bacterium]